MWLFNQTPIPHSGLQAIYKKYLQNTSSNLHFILGPPCILALEFLPMNVLAKLYHFDLSPFIKEFYHLLDLSNLPHVRFGRCFKAHIWQTFQKVRTEERLNGKFYMELTEKGLQFLTAEQDQRECRLVAQALQRHAMGSHLHQYIDNIVVYLRVLKKRPFECREQPHSDCDGSLNSGMILDSMIRAFKARDVCFSEFPMYCVRANTPSCPFRTCLRNETWLRRFQRNFCTSQTTHHPASRSINAF